MWDQQLFNQVFLDRKFKNVANNNQQDLLVDISDRFQRGIHF